MIEQAIKEYISASSFKKEQHSLCNEDKKEIQGRQGNDFCVLQLSEGGFLHTLKAVVMFEMFL